MWPSLGDDILVHVEAINIFSNVLRHASKAESQARKAGYSGVELYIDAKNISRGRLLDFMKNGPLSNIPKQGTIGAIYVRTADGWVVIPG